MRRARQRRGLAQHQAAEVDRVQAVGVLGRVHQLQHTLGVQPGGQGQLDDVTVARGVGVQLGDHVLDLLLAGVSGQVAADGQDAHLRAVAVLGVDVHLAAGVIADQHRRQARGPAAPGQLGYPAGQLVSDRGRGRLAVHDACAHCRHSARPAPWSPAHRPVGPPALVGPAALVGPPALVGPVGPCPAHLCLRTGGGP